MTSGSTTDIQDGVTCKSIQYEEPFLLNELSHHEYDDDDDCDDDECDVNDKKENDQSINQFKPSRIYLVYLYLSSLIVKSCWSLLTYRWRLLLPLYRRINLPGFRNFAIIELMMIAAYLIVNGYYLFPHMFQMAIPRDDRPTYINKVSHSAFQLGSLGTWNVLALWLPITRHSIWNYLFGISFDRSVFYHIWVARVAIFILSLHGVGLIVWMLYNSVLWFYLTDGGITAATPSGCIAMAGGMLLIVTSISFIRRRWWEFFMKSHYVGLVIFTVFGMMHDRMVIKVTLAGVVLYGVDVLIRAYKWSKPVQLVDVRVISEEITRLEWKLDGFEFEAGQFVMICIPLLSPFEWHPFTIASSPHHKSFVMYSRRGGEWTKRLQQLAESFDSTKPFKIFIEGPYGNLTVPLPMYKHVMLVSGGLGATPMFSIYNDMKQKNQDCFVQFIWSMRDQNAMEAMWSDMKQIDVQDCDVIDQPSRFTEHLHVTSTLNRSILHADYVISEGRPPLVDMFNAMEEKLIDEEFAHCAVLVCGPNELIKQCRKLCAGKSKLCGSRVCFDMHDERFEW